MESIKNINKRSINRGISIELLIFLGFSCISFGSSFEDQWEREEMALMLFQQHSNRQKELFNNNPALDDPNMRLLEIQTNITFLKGLQNLSQKAREYKLKSLHKELCQKHELRKQVAADPAMKKKVDKQRQQHANWLKTCFQYSDEALAVERNKMQAQLRTEQNSKNPNLNLISLLNFRLCELDALRKVKSNMKMEELENLCQWHQIIEELPLEKSNGEFQQNLDAIQNMLDRNQENPETFSQWLGGPIMNLETIRNHLQIMSQPTIDFEEKPLFAFSPFGFD
ncbi:MAG: hypothetical protein LBR92_01390 [Puniceicoccales bacterium]|jgi:hypothetical protein|nr:hypothetical protein [Puniceicoccales bacterium]